MSQNTRLPVSFAWLNATQFLGALNDNIFRSLVMLFLIHLMGKEHQTTVIATSFILFVIPFLLFSHAAGVLADRISKQTIIVIAKGLEIAVMFVGCWAVYVQSPKALYGVLFLSCSMSALFGPSKYGIIPELVGESALSKANSQIEAFSYTAIIAGTFLSSFFLDKVFTGAIYFKLSFVCIGITATGLLTSLAIPKTPSAGSQKRFSPLFLVEIYKTLRETARDRHLFLAIVGSAFFLFLGAFIQQNGLPYGQQCLGMNEVQSGYLFPVAALGIGVGALLSGLLSGRNIEFGIVPIGALGLTLSCILLGIVPATLPRALTLIFLAGVSAGLFIVPLAAFIQYRSPKKQLGEILACTNFLSFLGVALSVGLFYVLTHTLHLTAQQGFLAIGLLTGLLAAAAIAVLPDFLVRCVGVIVTRLFYRIRSAGQENLPLEEGALLVSNHVTWVDSLLISATQQRRIRFMMEREIYANRWLNPLFRLMRVIPVSAADGPHALQESLNRAREEMDKGYLVCIFAEGALTRNGNLRAFKPGFERIVKGTRHPVIPVHIGGAWGSIFSYYHGRILGNLPASVPYPVTILFGPPLPPDSPASRVREAVLELSALSFELAKTRGRTLPRLFVATARRFWFRPALADSTGARLTFGKTLVSSLALSGEIARLSGDQDKIGILMPASAGGALANAAITLLGKIPVNLNFTASADSLASALRQCRIRTVISSQAFLAKLDGLKAPEGTVFLEDLVRRLTPAQKLSAWLKAVFVPTRFLAGVHAPKPDDVATIIFSSGSTGEPKGVMLSHHNIISNIESFLMILRFGKKDGMCGALPFFHSFGFTCTLWCPLLKGFRVVYHPNPLDGAKIAALIREHRLTVLLATPTFLLSYIRRAEREDFATLRLVVTGAEKLKKKLADAFEEKFGVRPLEGYGATELSPVAALGVPDVQVDGLRQAGTREGSIGHPIPGVVMRIVDADTGAPVPEGTSGLLKVKGPNVMLGYLGQPEKTAEVLDRGWYSTGDIARMDDDGFVFLLDRASRYSKIGGEMVPHLAVEEKILQALKTMNPAVFVTAAPDEKKGEQLVVLHTPEAGDAEILYRLVADSDLPNLWKPRKDNFFRLETLPTLGSGKLDLKKLKQTAIEMVDKRSIGAINRDSSGKPA